MPNKQKKLLLLGGLRFLIPVIKAAHKLNIHVTTCDNLPSNIAHKHSDEYYNVSIIDKDNILMLAKNLNINGIMSFAVDPGVLTAAYVADKLGLSSPGPYESIKVLQNKVQFRQFLKNNNFNTPNYKGFFNENISDEDLSDFKFPVIVKPVDSAGSKGVTKVSNKRDLPRAIKDALSKSFSGQYIIEEFITQKGFSSDADCFSINGEMKYFSFSNQRFDNQASNPYVPSAFSWPSYISEKNQTLLKSELQRLVKMLNLKTSVYNVEVREGTDGEAYIMEMSPRGGGNRLSEMEKIITGEDLIANAIKAAIGDKDINISQKPKSGFWAEIILHSNKNGRFHKLTIDKNINQNNVIEIDLWVEKGDNVTDFKGANDAIGTIILKFDNQDKMEQVLNNQNDYIRVEVK